MPARARTSPSEKERRQMSAHTSKQARSFKCVAGVSLVCSAVRVEWRPHLGNDGRILGNLSDLSNAMVAYGVVVVCGARHVCAPFLGRHLGKFYDYRTFCLRDMRLRD